MHQVLSHWQSEWLVLIICQFEKINYTEEWLTLKTSVLPSTYSGFLAFINSFKAKLQKTHNFCISLNKNNPYGIPTRSSKNAA